MRVVQLEWKSLVSLKIPVIIAFVLMWNAGFLLAMYPGGGGLGGGLTPIGMNVTGVVCLIACIFSLSVATIAPFQQAVVSPSRAENFSPRAFYFLAFIFGFFAISRFVFPAGQIGANVL